jgi:hypothetical protein
MLGPGALVFEYSNLKFFEAQNQHVDRWKVNVLDEAPVFECSIRDFFEAQNSVMEMEGEGVTVCCQG